jgi:hypothetical protein
MVGARLLFAFRTGRCGERWGRRALSRTSAQPAAAALGVEPSFLALCCADRLENRDADAPLTKFFPFNACRMSVAMISWDDL